MSEQPEAVPLVEKLRWVPENFKFEWPCHRDENGNALGHTSYPAGKICHQAAERIAELEAESFALAAEIEQLEVRLAEARELLIVADYGYPAAEPDTVHAVEKWRVLREIWMEAFTGQRGE